MCIIIPNKFTYLRPTYLPLYLSLSVSLAPQKCSYFDEHSWCATAQSKRGPTGFFQSFQQSFIYSHSLSLSLFLSFFLTQLLSLTILLIFLLLMIQKIKMYSQQSTSFTALQCMLRLLMLLRCLPILDICSRRSSLFFQHLCVGKILFRRD